MKNGKKRLAQYSGPVVDSMRDGIVVAGADDKKIYFMNRSLRVSLGYSEQEAERLSIKDIHPESDWPRIEREFSSVVGKKCWLNEGIPVKRKDGSIFSVDISGSSLTLEEKQFAVGIFRDNTARRRAERALRREKERFEQVAASSREWIWEVDARGLYLYASPAVKDLLGYEPEEIAGKKYFYDFFVPEDSERLKETALEMFSKKLPFRGLMNKNLHKDGREVWLMTSGVPVLDAGGNLMGYRGADMDITEIKKAQDEVVQLSQAIMMTTDAVALVDLEGRVLQANQAMLALHGLTDKNSITGKLAIEFLAPEEREGARVQIQQLLKDKGTVTREYTVLAGDGRRIPVETTISVVKDNQKKVSGLIAITRDIAERKEKERILKESRQKLAAVFDASSEIIFTKDRQGRYTQINNAFERLFNRPAQDIIGKNDEALFTKEETESIRAIDEEIFRKKTARESEDVLSVCGRQHIFRTKKVPLFNEEGEVMEICGFADDITDWKKAHEKLLESEATLRTVFSTVPVGIGMVRDRALCWINEYMTALTGYTQKELEGKNALLLYPDKEEYERVGKEKYAQIRVTGKGTVETRFKRKDGMIIDVLLNSCARDKDDLSSGVIFTAVDISSRKRVEKIIQERHNEFSALFDNIPVAMLIVDEDRRVRKANRAACAFSGRDNHEHRTEKLRGGDFFRCVYTLDDPRGCGFGPACERCTIRNTVLETFKEQTGRYRVQASASLRSEKDPKEFTFLMSTVVIMLSQERLVLVCLEDITELKGAERELRQKIDELNIFNKVAVDREIKMVELKKTIERLKMLIQETGGQLPEAL